MLLALILFSALPAFLLMFKGAVLWHFLNPKNRWQKILYSAFYGVFIVLYGIKVDLSHNLVAEKGSFLAIISSTELFISWS